MVLERYAFHIVNYALKNLMDAKGLFLPINSMYVFIYEVIVASQIPIESSKK